MLNELAEEEGAPWHHSPGSDTRRSGSTRTAASASTSTRSSAARRAPTASASPSASTRSRVTHGHGDHAGDAIGLQAKFGCPVFGMVELIGWLGANGLPDDKAIGFNKGGTIEVAGVKVTMTNAFHSSSAPDGTYTGEPAGFVFHLEDGKRVYFAGDTCVFGDMQLIARLYAPDVAVLPIGDHYTMGPDRGRAGTRAARQSALRAVPLGDVPAARRPPGAAGRADQRARSSRSRPETRSPCERAAGARAVVRSDGPPRPRDRARRRPRPRAARWCSTPSTTRRPSAQAHDAGRPVVVRAATAADVKRALARPEVASALVTDPALLDLDLTELTYG